MVPVNWSELFLNQLDMRGQRFSEIVVIEKDLFSFAAQ
jgi:hypothetical protein